MIGLALEGSLHEANETLIEGNLLLFDTIPTGMVQSLGQALGLMPAKGTVVLSKSPGSVVLRDNMIVGAREIGQRRDRGGQSDLSKADGRPAYRPTRRCPKAAQ